MIENEISINGKFAMKVHFNLRKKKGSAKSQIWLTTTIDGERAQVYTGQRIEEKYWIKTSRTEVGERVRESEDFGHIQNLTNIKVNDELRKILGYCHEYGLAVSQKNLLVNPLPHNKASFEDFIGHKIRGEEVKIRKEPKSFILDYIERKSKQVNKNTGRTIDKGTIYNHKNALGRLEEFCKSKHCHLVWDLFNSRFEENFTAWMNEEDFSVNTIASQYSIIKVWLTEAEKEGLITDKSFHSYPTATHEVDNIYLTEDEILRIYKIDFNSEEIKNQIDPQSKIEESRDLFVVACWTGLRYGDWKDLSKASLSDNSLTITTHKTNKTVKIPFHPLVKAILEKYDRKLPKAVDKTHTLAHIRLCGKFAGIDQPTLISKVRGGKEVTRKEPKYKFIMNHTARRSFATNMYLRKVPIISIMAITGHTTEANFMKYIKLTADEHAEVIAESFKNDEKL